MIQLVAINKITLNDFWEQLEPLVAKALEKGYGEMDTDDIHSMVEDDRAIILAGCNGDIKVAITLIIKDMPALRELVILTCGGKEIDSWLDYVMDSIYNIAKEKQADVITIHGRRGWIKKLESYGYEEQYTTVLKRVQ